MQARRLLAIVGLLFLALVAQAENIEVRSAAITLRDDTYALDADFDITLTSTL